MTYLFFCRLGHFSYEILNLLSVSYNFWFSENLEKRLDSHSLVCTIILVFWFSVLYRSYVSIRICLFCLLGVSSLIFQGLFLLQVGWDSRWKIVHTFVTYTPDFNFIRNLYFLKCLVSVFKTLNLMYISDFLLDYCFIYGRIVDHCFYLFYIF